MTKRKFIKKLKEKLNNQIELCYAILSATDDEKLWYHSKGKISAYEYVLDIIDELWGDEK